MVRLPVSEFTYTNYNRVDLPWATIGSRDAYHKHLLSLNIVGYCDGGDLEIRPRPGCVAVMIEDEYSYQSWVHVPKDVWAEFMRRRI